MSENETPVSRFWSFVSRQLVLDAPLWNWRIHLGGDIDFEKFRKKYLSPTDKFSNLITCPKVCRADCGFRKVCQFEGKYEAVCHNWPLNSLAIDRVDALKHQLKSTDLLSDLVRVLNIKPDVVPFQAIDDSWRLGTLDVCNQTFRTFLTFRNWEHEMVDLILNLNRMEPDRYILLVPSKRLISPTSEGALHDHGSVVVPLDEILDFDQNAELIITVPLEPYLNMLVPEMTESDPDNIFRRCGDAWEVRFQGGEKFMLTTGHTGATYLHFMLARPNVATSVLEIMKSVSGEPENCVSTDRLDEDELTSGYSLSDLPNGQTDSIADEAAIRQYRQEMQLIMKEITDAEAAGDNITAEQLRQDMDKLTTAIDEAVSPIGQKKKFAEQKKKPADAFRSSVNFTIERLAEYDIELMRHLRKAIKCGYTPGYFPDEKISWWL